MDQPRPSSVSTQPLPVGTSEAAEWVTASGPGTRPPGHEPVRAARVVTKLVAGLVLVLLLVGFLGSFAAQRLAEREAVNDAASTADVLAEAVIEPALTDALVAGDPEQVRLIDAVVRERVLGANVVRVKLWSPNGTVLYADEPQLIGRTFALSAEQAEALSDPKTLAEVSNLEASENEFETAGRLLEVYRPVWTPGGTELLFEVYAPYEPVLERSGQLWRGFAGVTVSSLLLLVVLMAPILWQLLRRLGMAQRRREQWLEQAVTASDAERRRIAATLHDGPVQELAATSFAASGAAARAESAGSSDLAAELRELATALRGNIRALRSLLVDIYPPSLAGAGLATALADLAESANGRGVTVQLDLEPVEELGLSEADERLVYRVAQECLRNVAAHAAPCTATVRLWREDGFAVLDVLDDGPGFDPNLLRAPAEGHFGLRVLADLATDAGATLQVASAPGRGAHWQLLLEPGRVHA